MSAKDTFSDPGHWAVTAFSATSLMLGLLNAGLVNPASLGIIIPTAFIFGGLVQIIVAIIEVGRGSTFGMVAFGTYGPFWIILGLFFSFNIKTIPAANAGGDIALFLWMFAIITLYLLIASLKTDIVLAIIFVLLFITFVLLALGNGMGTSGTSLVEAGGYTTIAFAILGFYHAASGTITSTWGRVVLPIGSLAPKAPAQTGQASHPPMTPVDR